MCFSAQTVAAYRRFEREFGAILSLEEFVELYGQRLTDKRIKIPKSMDLAFADPRDDAERRIQSLIGEFAAQQAAELEQDLFAQRKRLADAERTLQTKTTKAATESRRIATDKVSRLLGRLADLRRTEPKDRDARIFPGYYAPVIVMEAGRRVVKPMRYQCRPAGKPAFYDTKYPGTFNARRDNLEGFWKGQFGVSHGLMLVSAFYENVSRQREDGSTENVVLEFKPAAGQDMLVACLWSRWTAPGEPDLLSFAAITDEPPQEVAAAGHDRCIVPIQAAHIDAWLSPDPKDLAASHAILDERERPYYEHRLAA
jgi:putative SOS response-associated peptidase YedK